MKTNWDLTVFYKDFDDPEFKDDLANGKLSSEDEVRDVVAEFNDKLTANGVDKIVAEVQSQIDAWTAAKAAE